MAARFVTCLRTAAVLSGLWMIGCAGAPAVTQTQPSAGTQTAGSISPAGNRIDDATVETVRMEKPLEGVGPFTTIICAPIEASDEYKRDYPEDLNLFQTTVQSDLENKKRLTVIREQVGGKTTGRAIRVEGKILSMRMVSRGARIWVGAMAGASYMEVQLKLIDAASGLLLKELIIGSHNNAFGAEWSNSDHSLPVDMGHIISEYLAAVIPA